MRTVLDFPDGLRTTALRSDRNRAASARYRTASPSLSDAGLDRAPPATCPDDAVPSPYVPGPFQVRIATPSESDAMGMEPFASGGFRPSALEDLEIEEPVCREPQSLVVTTMIVGILLAFLGYAFDMR